MPLTHFLIVFDRSGQKVVTAEQFEDGEIAAERYIQLEREHGTEQNMEIVLVGSDSLATVRRTHGNYFGDDAELPFRELVS